MEHNIKKKGRPVWTDKEKAERKELKELFKEHSTDALNALLSIMHNSMDSTNRLKASIYILDKITPKTYDEEETQEYNPNITITLAPVKGNNNIDFDAVEEQIQQIEEGTYGQPQDNREMWDVDSNTPDDNDSWGNDVYDPSEETWID